MTLRRNRRQPRGKRFLLITLLLLLVAGGVGGFILFFEGNVPVANFKQTSDYIGKKGNIGFQVTDKGSGINTITVTATQGSLVKNIHSMSFPRTSYNGAVGPLEDSQSLAFDPIKMGFKDGPMTISITASDFSFRGWFKGNTTTITKEVTIDTIAPKIHLLHGEKYLSPGGTGIAIYKVKDKEATHGVEINGMFNAGFLLDATRDDTFISYFALPYDANDLKNLKIVAVDKAGNSTVFPFSTTFKQANQKSDTINVGDSFLNKKIPEFQQYYPEMQGDFIDKYLYANGNVRRLNNAKITELCQNPNPERLWDGSFSRMPGSSRAGFADHRTYKYKGEAVDHQVHLGMDIASTRRADVRSANNGVVKFADYLGIYGNMVLIDHGQGVCSLYSHLSQINVNPGDTVNQKTVLGLTGTTGMAGGDHLHFSMLIHGVFVTPKEWWDQHWVEVTIEEPITDSKF
ncbi:MAG: murein DD-endopeptidase MepM/ murein hydrolase activator NlpD [Desulforhopalus sp.]|jgi:murein DD-endopeptidase MepM/ murein hydrolase activator NlpD